MKVKDIRAHKNHVAIYMDMIAKKKRVDIPLPEENVGLDYTKGLTYKRQWMCDNGYADLVEETDREFLEQYRTGERKDRFEEFWAGYVSRHSNLELEEKYADAL